MADIINIVLMVAGIGLGIWAAWLLRTEGRSVRKGLGVVLTPWAVGDFAGGLLITGITMVLIFATELALNGIRVTGTTATPAGVLVDNVPFIAGMALLEEVLYRMLLLTGLVRLLNGRKWTAILITGVVFGLVHVTNPNASLVSAVSNGLGGVIYGIAFLGGRNLWLPWGLHVGWNLSQVLLGFPVSGQVFAGILVQAFLPGSETLTGGAFGPEAGAIGFASRFLIIALVLGYLKLRSGGRGSVRTLDFPIAVYDNPSTTTI